MPAPEDADAVEVPQTAADLLSYHERNAGRLVVDPAEAQRAFGKAVAARLKLSADGRHVLWPQPTSDPEDPQNWSDARKNLQLLIITLASIVPDFVGSIGVASIFPLAAEYHTTADHINAISSNWAILLLGIGGFVAVTTTRRLGRLPVLFHSQLLALAFLVLCTFAPTLNTFAAARCIAAFFSTAPQITGLYTVTDMYPFHLQARKLNLWTMGFIVSPFLSPFFLGFMVAHVDYKWAYVVGALYSLGVLLMIVVWGEETLYDRLRPPPPSAKNLRTRAETLLGLTGARRAHLRPSWAACVAGPLRVVWRPQALGVLVFGTRMDIAIASGWTRADMWLGVCGADLAERCGSGVEFGHSIGITITNAVFLGTPAPAGFGLSQTGIAAMYATPIVATLIGEVAGRYGNDVFAAIGIRRNRGVFEAEVRLWMCYVSLPLYLTGFLLLGHGIQVRSLPEVVMGWGIGQVAIMLNTTAIYAYLQDCFPAHGGEVSALFNFFRTIAGFAIVFFQAPWLEAQGGFRVFGIETAIVGALFVLIIPLVQMRGRAMRARYSLRPPAPAPAPPTRRSNTFRLSQIAPVAAPDASHAGAAPPTPIVPGLKLMVFPSASMEVLGLGLEDGLGLGPGVKTSFAGASTSTVGVP
ncbi:major facilitator superfamily domain-containing protein [Mycena rosella]|uniref:Major facilitator superfamily domain-containing protein n=1 Tax=Mycena rosella TaxID=1033263 RepID=A0AAD7GIB1_MYCRO|nr:major facilitator superfamily domain-containing protein [Mycena rosella]